MEITTVYTEALKGAGDQHSWLLPKLRHLGRAALIGGMAFVAAATLNAAPKLVSAEIRSFTHSAATEPPPSAEVMAKAKLKETTYGPKPTSIRQLLNVYALQEVDHQDGTPDTYRYIVDPAIIVAEGDQAVGRNPDLQDEPVIMKPGQYVLCRNPNVAPVEVVLSLGINYVTGTFRSGTARSENTGSLDQLPWACLAAVNSHGQPIVATA